MIKRIIKPLVWLYCWIRYGRRKRVAHGPTILYFEPSPEYKAAVERWLVPNMRPTGSAMQIPISKER